MSKFAAPTHDASLPLAESALARADVPDSDELNAHALRLLMACARPVTDEENKAEIRELLREGIDWTDFAHLAIDHGLTALAAHTLARVAPDLMPDDILDALRMNLDQARVRNRVMFDEVLRLGETLKNHGIEAIALRGPSLAVLAYGDAGLRTFGKSTLLVRDSDRAATIAVLGALGYGRNAQRTRAQSDLIGRIEGRETLIGTTSEAVVEVRTRLGPLTMAIDIDYAGLWRRARPVPLHGRVMLMPSPEDMFIALAVHGSAELWRSVKWACDVAALIALNPAMNWSEISQRGKAQGCFRMLSLAALLAREHFQAQIPDEIASAAQRDPKLAAMARYIALDWLRTNGSSEATANAMPISNRSLLHDGVRRRMSHAIRSRVLPTADQVASMPATGGLSFAILCAPLWRNSRRAAEIPTLATRPNFVPVSADGASSSERHRREKAAAEESLKSNPNDAGAWLRLGDANFGLKHYREAITCYDNSLAIEPNYKSAWRRRGAAAAALGERVELPQSVRIPQTASAWATRAGALSFSRRFIEAVDASDRALSLDPANQSALSIGMHARLHSCDWRRREDDKQRIRAGLRSGVCLLVSSDHMSVSQSEEENLLAAQYVAKNYPASSTPLWRGERYSHDKIRIAYVSADLHMHATSFLMAGVFEHHDRCHFETTAISLGPDDGTAMRRRVEAAFDHFVDVQEMGDAEVARMIRNAEIDIVVDLKGYTGSARTGILAHRPAPLQVNYLGFPGTMALPFVDYIIADRFTIPEENRIYYSEKIAYLPHSYQSNDSKREISEATPSRAEAGLPENGFVFACLNNTYKIGPEVFEIWMRLLQAVEGSVLWLLEDNVSASLNLRREARARGIVPERLVFAKRVPPAEHLARHRLADLFLDTFPYNAHTTASDALWAGLPVLTCSSSTFASRVGASLLHAIGLPELVTTSLSDYENFAFSLAKNPERLAGIRATLQGNRDTAPLFDTRRFTRDIETAYSTMWERWQQALPAETFFVGPAP